MTGTESFSGSVPVAQTVSVSVDQNTCVEAVSISGVRANAKKAGLADAVVSVEGLSGKHDSQDPTPLATVEISNAACAFSP